MLDNYLFNLDVNDLSKLDTTKWKENQQYGYYLKLNVNDWDIMILLYKPDANTWHSRFKYHIFDPNGKSCFIDDAPPFIHVAMTNIVKELLSQNIIKEKD